MDSKRISLYAITVNYHGEAYLEKLVESLRPVSSLKGLVVVDHSSSVNPEDFSADYPIQIIRQENRGYGAGMNRGLREIACRDREAVAILCNPDITILTPDALEQAVEYLMDHPEVGCVVPSLVDRDLLPVMSCRRFYTPASLVGCRIPWLRANRPGFLRDHFYMDVDRGTPFDVDWGSGSAMILRVSLFPEQVCFDENFFLYFEDVDLCAQLWRAGLSVVCYPEAVFCHEEQKQSHRDVVFLLRHLKSLFKFCRKYRGLPNRRHLQRRVEDLSIQSSSSASRERSDPN